MNINFFEEYPTDENMTKLDLVDWPATVLVAAPSLREFERMRDKWAPRYTHITFGWWPTLTGSYWISGFSNPADLERLLAELASKKHETALPVLLDLELPLKKSLWFKNCMYLFRNKKRIARFLADAPQYNLKVFTAEYPAIGGWLYGMFRILGISPSFSLPHIKLPMCYTSMILQSLGMKRLNLVKKFEQQFAQSHQDRVGFGLGTIATGVLGNEPILSPEQLAEDLGWAMESGVEEVFIFRLGGLDDKYVAAMNNTNGAMVR